MEKAILKTLIYADIFDYPLKINEIQKWLIGREATLRQVEKALGKLVNRLQPACRQGRVTGYSGYYFLSGKAVLVKKRKRREDQSIKYLRKAKMLCQILKVVPWIKLVGISGGLALGNASKKDDIDLFIITAKNRLWICRLLALGLLSLTRQRRKVGDKGRKIAGKLCLNILLEEDRLEQINKDIFVAHELLQMKFLWQRNGIYSKYLEDNYWAFKFLPNWVGVGAARLTAKNRSHGWNLLASEDFVKNLKRKSLRQSAQNPQLFLTGLNFAALMDLIEKLAKNFQLKIMQKPKGMERIEDGALYFHPEDCRQEVLSEYRRRVKKLAPLDK